MISSSARSPVTDDTPVLFAWHAIEQYEDDASIALDAVNLMIRAVREALPGEAGARACAQIDWIATPEGSNRYPDPARLVATGLGAEGAHTIYAKIGVMQQTLITKAIEAVSTGAARIALVCGGEAKRRDLRARVTNAAAPPTLQDAAVEPDETWSPTQDLVLPCERATGLRDAAGFYAIMESAWRARQGQDIATSRARLGDLYARFTEVAAENPHAHRRMVLSSEEISADTTDNPMLAFPYTKRMISAWTVDQAAALLFSTAGVARALGISEDRWVFPAATAECNAMPALGSREDMTRSMVTALRGEATASATGLHLAELDPYAISCCFPIAVKSAAAGLGLADDRALTLTGGMPFAGGPLNNYVFQSTCRAAELLKRGSGATALVSCVSGLYTKQGFTVWSAAPPERPYAALDVTDEALKHERLLPIAESPEGAARIVGYTVLFQPGQPGRAVAVAELPDGSRWAASSQDPATIDRLMSDEGVGKAIRVSGAEFILDA